MGAELGTVLGSGAATLAGLMATDLWTQFKERVGRLLSRGADPSAVHAELERSRVELLTARSEGDQEAADDVTAHWRRELRRLLQADPTAVAELEALIRDAQALQPEISAGIVVHNTINGGTQQVVNQGVNFSGIVYHSGEVPGSAHR
ncbi:hypothetical protein [Streptacidiphilus sp. P02-A3a]|uniref:hypothetical protein n=1 Tax=Streptacidiphilus sp. P02-A3a TaxID=2704468 RepID=UPI0015FA4C9B|nr:hypothetical protein [Streptacidiphilus sp. P02-A3a]QMU69913.1 hypothetical protein GXP74_18500 [Streptacidiphilus sp. P02-A3a]